MTSESQPSLCPLCAASGIVATVAGPTCEHSDRVGLNWWPADFAKMQEAERVEFIKKNQMRNHKNCT